MKDHHRGGAHGAQDRLIAPRARKRHSGLKLDIRHAVGALRQEDRPASSGGRVVDRRLDRGAVVGQAVAGGVRVADREAGEVVADVDDEIARVACEREHRDEQGRQQH